MRAAVAGMTALLLAGGARAQMPPHSPAEDRFIQAADTAAAEYPRAANDMAKGGIRARRDGELCAIARQHDTGQWVGRIEQLDSTSDGKGVLSVRLSPRLTLSTWNNGLSDIGDNTLIPANSPVFAVAAGLKIGDWVAFSVLFAPSQSVCIREKSLTQAGSIDAPDILVRFVALRPIGG